MTRLVPTVDESALTDYENADSDEDSPTSSCHSRMDESIMSTASTSSCVYPGNLYGNRLRGKPRSYRILSPAESQETLTKMAIFSRAIKQSSNNQQQTTTSSFFSTKSKKESPLPSTSTPLTSNSSILITNLPRSSLSRIRKGLKRFDITHIQSSNNLMQV